ncbi:MAG: hypothetical protein J7601_12120 [Chloroflexi bacterium]|nr:hypothetical protein [Chloroflexota bacterium]
MRQRTEREGRTISEIVREAVDAYLSESNGQEDKNAEDNSTALSVCLAPDQRAALRARGNLERLIRCACALITLHPHCSNPPQAPRSDQATTIISYA